MSESNKAKVCDNGNKMKLIFEHTTIVCEREMGINFMFTDVQLSSAIRLSIRKHLNQHQSERR